MFKWTERFSHHHTLLVIALALSAVLLIAGTSAVFSQGGETARWLIMLRAL